MKLSDLLSQSNNKDLSPIGSEYARAYVRVSHEKSAEKNISPETQRRIISEYAKAQGYQIKEWYTDLAMSAFRNDDLRPQFRRMLAEAKADPETSVILVLRYDRFSRSWAAPGQQQDLLKQGVRIESASEGYYDPDSETGAIMMPLTWSLNRLYSIKLRNVVMPNMITNFESRDPETGWAYKNGGWSMFGYKKHRIKVGRSHKYTDVYKSVWVLDDRKIKGKQVWEWAKIMLLEWRLKEGLGYDSIAANLTKAGVPTPSGKSAWSHSTIQSLLGEWDHLWQYAGVAFWNREDCTDTYNRLKKETSEWITVENAHPAIITNEEAEAIWAMVQNRKRTNKNQSRSQTKFALSGGLLKCSVCGSNFAGVNKPAGNYYVCGSHIYRRGEGCSESWYIPREEIEALVISKILGSIKKTDSELIGWVNDLNAAMNEEWSNYEKTRPSRKKILKNLRSELNNYLELARSGVNISELKDRISDTSAKIHRYECAEAVKRPEPINPEDILNLKNNIQEIIETGDDEAKKQLIKEFVVEIIADPHTKTLEGTLNDPRALISDPHLNLSSTVGINVAVPRGRIHPAYAVPQIIFIAKYLKSKRKFWGAA